MSRSSPAGIERRQARRPVVAAVAVAWAALAAIGAAAGDVTPAHAGHGSAPGAGVDLVHVAIMVVAMMGPLVIAPLRQVVQRTLPRLRRQRATTVLVGCFVPWFVASVVLAELVDIGVRPALGRSGTLAAALVVAVAWQCTPFEQRCRNRTHAHSKLVAGANHGNAAALAGAVVHGGWCLGSCWALMLVSSAASHGLAVSGAAALWIWAVHVEPARRPTWRPAVPTRVSRAAIRFARVGARSTARRRAAAA